MAPSSSASPSAATSSSRVLSRLNPTPSLASSAPSTPSFVAGPLPSPVSPPLVVPMRSRGYSTSTIRPPPSSPFSSELNRVTSEPNVSLGGDLEIPLQGNHSLVHKPQPSPSTFSVFGITIGTRSSRRRSDSMEGQALKSCAMVQMGTSNAPQSSPSSWWGGTPRAPDQDQEKDVVDEVPRRPWRDPPRRKRTIPQEQTEGWIHTRERVTEALKSVLGTTAEVAHEVLLTSVDILELAPVPGLATAARVLQNIWDAVQLVETNRLACLRLTERCADLLYSVRKEIEDAGPSVVAELSEPIGKLAASFAEVLSFFQKQIHRPFLKRYLQRDEILEQIRSCDESLRTAMSAFGQSVQIRLIHAVHESERRRSADTQMLMEEIARMSPAINGGSRIAEHPTSSPVPPPMEEDPTITPATPHLPVPPSPLLTIPPQSPSHLRPSQILPALQNLHASQDSRDAARDCADLHGIMQSAIKADSDAEIIAVLQVKREEIAEAHKTLQRVREQLNQAQAVHAGTLERPGYSIVAQGKGKKEKERKRRGKSMAGLVGDGGDTESVPWIDQTLDREFVESGIDALRRMSVGNGIPTTLPSWTITRYEVSREEKIGLGFFSDVYRGTWRGRTVAIKVLAPTTPCALFVREVAIWQALRHQNVLELYGASSASGERPWFFVCAYMKRGSLVEFLKGVARTRSESMGTLAVPMLSNGHTGRGRATSFPSWGGVNGKEASNHLREVEKTPREGDLFRFMLEIARGMDYLHSNDVLHGDLKGANILVDDDLHCVISDFGQSEMKSEAYRISGTAPLHGTLRWQAPELMSGMTQLALTPQMDVYAYAITCVEIIAWGKMPWPFQDDDAVRHFVLRENTRPALPQTRFNTPALQELLRMCWHQCPDVRPSFNRIVDDVKEIRKDFLRNGGNDEMALMSPVGIERELERQWGWDWDWDRAAKASPDMRPLSLQTGDDTDMVALSPNSTATDMSFLTAPESLFSSTSTKRSSKTYSPAPLDLHFEFELEDDPAPHIESTVASAEMRMPEPVLYQPSTRTSSLFSESTSNMSLEDLGLDVSNFNRSDNCASPAPENERIAQARDERRYRLLLRHPFHPSLTLPLWEPTPVRLGAVGYLSKPAGKFITLFNSLEPEQSENPATSGLPSLRGYGRVDEGNTRHDKRNAAQRGYDAFVGLLTFKGRSGPSISQSVSRRYSFPLRAGHKTAHLLTETTVYNYLESLEVPKKWFKANVDAIMQIYGQAHHVQKEDLYLGTAPYDIYDLD
ncbi:hypothetical protein H0H81_005844 [Sphagnurus paluster]|uniref:Protein kinase domain-containing protein n=1 Tax=Sphagnurus paluster TaxID=117069 RepID=A0A9P7FRN4_9AGAR|nr:hypothetical protein H0H81_005844 [Sphagnurus paluster]